MGFTSPVFSQPEGIIANAPFVVEGKEEEEERSVHPGLMCMERNCLVGMLLSVLTMQGIWTTHVNQALHVWMAKVSCNELIKPVACNSDCSKHYRTLRLSV